MRVRVRVRGRGRNRIRVRVRVRGKLTWPKGGMISQVGEIARCRSPVGEIAR